MATNRDAGSLADQRDRISGIQVTLVVKSLDTVLLRDGGYDLFTYTILNPGGELAEETVSAAPLLAQRALEEKTDIRVTVVGNEVFAVRILSQGSGIEGDWRVVPKPELEHRDISLSRDITERCKLLTRSLSLSFAAIDLIETRQGVVYFIEINPTGGWGWLSTAERSIDKAIASWLATPHQTGDENS